MNTLKLSLFKEKKLPPLSVDIKGIIIKFTLPCKEKVKANKTIYLNNLKLSTKLI
jgi:hypothetical protein